MPNNVVQGPGAQAGGSGVSAASPAPGGSEDPIGDATKVMNALATLKKAGVPVTDDEVNQALASAGLPPLQAGIPIPEPITPPAPSPKKSFSLKRSDGTTVQGDQPEAAQ
jgi:hypothetical protein